MAVEQSAQLAGPGPLIRPKPCPLSKKTKPLVSSLDSENAAATMPGPKTSGSANTTQNAVNTGKNKYQDLKTTFKDGVKANRKVSNTGVSTLSQTCVGSTDGKIKRTFTSESSAPCSEEVGVTKWVKNVASKSQLQPSAPPSTRSAQAVSNNNSEWTEDVDEPETFDEQMVKNRAGKTAKDASRGKKCAFSDLLEEEEECEVRDDPDADEGPNVNDPVEDVDNDVEMVDQQLPEVGTKANKAVKTRLTTSMSVDIVESDDSKPVKTESANGKWHSKFLPAVMYWVGNSNYPWTIPDDKLSDVCYDIFSVVYNGAPGEFEADSWSGGFHVDSRCVYEDPDNEDSPGAFLSEFILRVFSTHLNAMQGYEKIDIIDCGLPGHQAALALATAAAERTLILARDNLILLDDTSDNDKKLHKIALTLNQATNKMSNTGTAFSSGNWEMDTIAYMERIDELSLGRILEIVA
ncbi:hypothetical protein DFJ58DRAFT_723879 [Suillus subalutaceus]|uniref:uncharacterized protein n=1 Tax=Suillus subalutaceus TaxID=48586 RepID=UPI001B85CF2B|nr:uncharacterized protein DFJ58DRAFT_723879 [Suillus subalutaceus]KAG1867190.1 hypothetical protein DFJ58DRAFT_723879 [Suillus subalutaceus]